jgi:CO/xanthine dehydrogenase FAD-binding subunit
VGPHEIVTEVVVPRPRTASGGAFLKLAKTTEDIAKVNVAVFLETSEGICARARIALGSVGPTPLRAVEAERLLEGKELGEPATPGAQARSGATTTRFSPLVTETAEAAMEVAMPISDVRSTSAYRKEMVRVLVRDALERATSRALGEGRPQ